MHDLIIVGAAIGDVFDLPRYHGSGGHRSGDRHLVRHAVLLVHDGRGLGLRVDDTDRFGRFAGRTVLQDLPVLILDDHTEVEGCRSGLESIRGCTLGLPGFELDRLLAVGERGDLHILGRVVVLVLLPYLPGGGERAGQVVADVLAVVLQVFDVHQIGVVGYRNVQHGFHVHVRVRGDGASGFGLHLVVCRGGSPGPCPRSGSGRFPRSSGPWRRAG